METNIDWPTTYKDGVALQLKLREKVVIKPFRERLRFVGGVDTAVSSEQAAEGKKFLVPCSWSFVS